MPAQEQRTNLYAAAGPELTHYDVGIEDAELVRRATLTLPSKVQYVWPHPSAPYLYAACSEGGPGAGGKAHHAVALRVDPASGALAVHGAPVALPSRPIHLTLDVPGRHAIIAYNNPSGLTVHRIEADGIIGAEVKQRAGLDTGIYAHQVRVAPSNRAVVVVARGNPAKESRPEDPGALKIFAYEEGQVTPRATLAPNGGYGFQPRHLDFHRSQPWVYVSLEPQSLLQMYRAPGDAFEPTPAYAKEALADRPGQRPRQRSGTIHVHPNGRFVYLANRASGTADIDGKPLYIGGENNIAVYAIDQRSGEPTAIQHAETHGVVPRTFALDRTGRLMVAANSVPILAQGGSGVVTVPPSLAVFRVGADGKLDYVRKYDVDAGSEVMFWMGIV